MILRATRRIGVVAAAALLVLGACGVGSNDSASDDETPSSTVTTPSTEASTEPEPDEVVEEPEDEDRTEGAALVERAAEQALEARSFRIEGTSVMAVSGAVGATVTMEGAFDAENEVSHMVMEIDSDVGALGDMRLESIETPDTSYYKGPAMFGGSGDDWIVEPIEEAAETRAAMPAQSPAGVFGFLRASSAEIEELGSDEIRGDDTTHFRAVLDLGSAIENESSERIARMMTDWRSVMEMQTADAFDTVTFDIWVDEEDHIRRLAYDIELMAGPAETVIDFFDYGEPVDIEIPNTDGA